MQKIIFIPNTLDCLENIIEEISLDTLEFLEYDFISIDEKKSYVRNKIRRLSNLEDHFSFCAYSENKIIAFVSILKDSFDSEIFGIDIYKVNYISIFEKSIDQWESIVFEIMKHLHEIISIKKRNSYFLIGLNTNTQRNPLLMNLLINSGFYYVQTLLTYKMLKNEYPSLTFNVNEEVTIREAKNSDVDDLMNLASKSFKYSRFHLDPFLNNEKANILLATSVKNSVMNKFVDIMYVSEFREKIVGYYSAKKRFIKEFNLTFGEAVISAVDENYRGKGIFKALNKSLIQWFYENTDFAEMGTYIVNLPVHKTWSNNGLSIVRGIHQLAHYVPY